MANHHDHHHADHSGAESDDAATAELLDLDAEVLHSYLSEVTACIHELAADLPNRRILDLGSGTGTGTVALLQRFEQSEVIALDLSAQLLEHLRDKARTLGLADRIRTVQADLDTTWPVIDPVGLVWASASLHHMADPDRALAAVFAVLHPGGLLAVAELDSFPRFLPEDLGLGRPGLEERGFTIEVERRFAIDLVPPLPAATGRYAVASLRRMRSGLEGRIRADDLAVLDTLIDSDGPDGILQREDLTVRAARTLWVARRP